MKKVLDFVANLRTSTKSGAAGIVVQIAALFPFYDEIAAYAQQACESVDGPIPFLISGFVVWVTMLVSARFSKTPEEPGAL